MLRKLNIASQVVRRNIHITRTSPSFFKNLKESIDKEAEKEGIKEDLKKTQIDLEQIAQEQKIKAEKFAESDKFKKVLKETETTSEKLAKNVQDVTKKIGLDSEKLMDGAEKYFEKAKNYEFTQTPEDRMAVFEDDYTALNYKAVTPRLRKQIDDKYKNVVFDADTESEGIAVHRDYQIYERLKNSTMGKKLDDLSTRVSASESNFVRGGIYFTSKIGNKLSKLTTNDFNECMKTIRQVDPNFTQDNFVRFLEKEMIPIVLEAAAMNDQEVVEDWALDAPSQKLLLSHNAAKKEKLKFFEKTLALTRVELGQAKNQDDGTPVIQVSFETNKLMAFTDKDGNITSGDGVPQPDEVYKCYYEWVVVRDMMEPEPSAAWRVLECDSHAMKLAF